MLWSLIAPTNNKASLPVVAGSQTDMVTTRKSCQVYLFKNSGALNLMSSIKTCCSPQCSLLSGEQSERDEITLLALTWGDGKYQDFGSQNISD